MHTSLTRAGLIVTEYMCHDFGNKALVLHEHAVPCTGVSLQSPSLVCLPNAAGKAKSKSPASTVSPKAQKAKRAVIDDSDDE